MAVGETRALLRRNRDPRVGETERLANSFLHESLERSSAASGEHVPEQAEAEIRVADLLARFALEPSSGDRTLEVGVGEPRVRILPVPKRLPDQPAGEPRQATGLSREVRERDRTPANRQPNVIRQVPLHRIGQCDEPLLDHVGENGGREHLGHRADLEDRVRARRRGLLRAESTARDVQVSP